MKTLVLFPAFSGVIVVTQDMTRDEHHSHGFQIREMRAQLAKGRADL